MPAPTSQPTFRPSNSLEPLKIITNELAENLGLGGGPHPHAGPASRRGHNPHHDSGYISPNLPPGSKGFFDQQPPPPQPPPTQPQQPPHHHPQRVDPLLLQQVLQRPKSQMMNPRPITGARNHHQHQHRQHSHHHNPGPNQYRGYHPKNYYDPYDLCSLLPPPEFLRNMPPPIHNQVPVPNLPCLTDPYASGEINRGYYPHLPPHWRPAIPPPPPPPPHIYRGGRPAMQPPSMAMNSHTTRHFRSGNSTELHNK